MSLVYHVNSSYSTIYSKFLIFLLNLSPSFPLDFIKFLPAVSIAIASKESIISSDLASFIASRHHINFDSALKNISRFFSNPNYDFDFFFAKFISSILSSFKIKHLDRRLFLVFDHMTIEHKFIVFMISLKLGKQSIPLYFKTFDFHDKDAYSYDTFVEGISFCHILIKSIDPIANIFLLGDRFWGNHFKLMHFIASLGDTYYIRTKGDTIAFAYDKHDKLVVRKKIKELNSFKYHSIFYNNIPISFKRHHMNLAISKSAEHKEPFYILTNGDPRRAIKDYSYRFGAIEFCFKSQKSNGFFLEESQLKDLYSFNSLYTCVCIAQTILTLIGIDYSKNPSCYKNYKIRNARIVNGHRRKDYSFFHIGLILLEAALNGAISILNRFILYDV